MFFGGLRAGLRAARARENEIEEDACSIPAAYCPQDQRHEKSENSRPVPLSTSHAFAHRAQDFSALCDAKKDRTGNESDQKTKTARLKFVVEIANAPPTALNPGAVILFSVHKGGLLISATPEGFCRLVSEVDTGGCDMAGQDFNASPARADNAQMRTAAPRGMEMI